MKHTKLTNLIGEQCLGDLDYNIFTRRNASLHFRSFISMMSRNQTMSTWFQGKSQEEQRRLLSLSAKKGPALRKHHREHEKRVLAERKQHLTSVRLEKEKKHERAMARKTKLVETVKENGGPCSKPSDVIKLVKKLKSQPKSALRNALNAEIQFQKTVLGSKSKSPLVKTTKHRRGWTYQGL